MKMKFVRLLAAVAVSFPLLGSVSAQPADSGLSIADDAALRGLLIAATHAVNTRNFKALSDTVRPGFTVITVDNQKLVGVEEVEKYYSRLVDGPDAILLKMQIKPVAEELSIVTREATGIVNGLSVGEFSFRRGGERSMKIRWSAGVAKEGERWKLANTHLSANLLANPLLDVAREEAERTTRLAALTGLAVGVAGGLLVMAFWLRRTSRARTKQSQTPAE